ncbi:TonB-dependent receptor [Stakelama sp. CBK3Z-3]|uniref:TonB-dependent receptor n=1 Tax=Stakelama flava TaxID=2860338 RepID=A0ABS6XJ38_9SPHN|nr:TonB-dependent receptor [Stakelama flava]MBW4330206.1 TonB-dependent receptor [Stakelama flava]
MGEEVKIAQLLAGIALIAPATVHAQQTGETVQAPQPDAAGATDSAATGGTDADSGEILVTATRTPTAIDRIASSVTVLDKDAIDRAGDLTVADLLLRTPGVSLSRNGGYGTATSLRIRGAETDQTVVVIDGVKLNDPSSTGGGYNFGNLLIGDAARIEVLRGPQSTLWGSQAIGGVVNIVTPMPQKSLEGSFDVSAGSRNTVSGRAAIGGRTGPLSWRVGGQTFTTDGISAIAPEYGGSEKDGYTNRSASGRAVLDITDGISADVRGYYGHGRTEIDGFSGDTDEYSLNDEFVGYAGLNIALFDGRLRNRIGYAYTDTDRDNYDPARERKNTFDAAGKNERIEYQGSLAITRRIDATFGAEHEISRFRSVSPAASLSTPIPEPARGRAEVNSFYGQVNAEVIDGLTLTGGVRNDDHNSYGDKTLFAGGAVWKLPSNTILRASYSEGFKAPSLYQLYSEYGNQTLDPERAKGWEAGVEQRLLGGLAAIGATYFERRSHDLIDYSSCSTDSDDPMCVIPGTTTPRYGYYRNVDRAFAQGIEAAGRLRFGGLLIDGNYTWTLSEDRSPDSGTYGNQLGRRPRHSWNASATYTLPAGISLGGAVRWSGASYDSVYNSTRLDSYTLVDLRLDVPLSDDVTLFMRGDNVFDEDYRTAARYSTLGRSIRAGLRGRF